MSSNHQNITYLTAPKTNNKKTHRGGGRDEGGRFDAGPLHFFGSIPPAVDLFLLLLKIEKRRDLPNLLFHGTLPSIV
jgi:hypothetical protein